jgi:hypothetical protein
MNGFCHDPSLRRATSGNLRLPRKPSEIVKYEIRQIFYFPLARPDFWMLGITEQ